MFFGISVVVILTIDGLLFQFPAGRMSPRYECDRRFVGLEKRTHFASPGTSERHRIQIQIEANRPDRPNIQNDNYAATFEIEILTNDGYVSAYYQIRWIFSNIMAKPKPLIFLHSISRAKMAADSRLRRDRGRRARDEGRPKHDWTRSEGPAGPRLSDREGASQGRG
jgi:hypothetical protein